MGYKDMAGKKDQNLRPDKDSNMSSIKQKDYPASEADALRSEAKEALRKIQEYRKKRKQKGK